MNYHTPDEVRREFLRGEINYLDAIEALQESFGFSSLDAEKQVGEWQEAEL